MHAYSERESGQTTLQQPASSTVALGTYDILQPSSRRLVFPSDEREEEEQQQQSTSTFKFFYAVNKTAVISLFFWGGGGGAKSHSKAVSGYWDWIPLTPYPISSWSLEKCAKKKKKWGLEVLPCTDFVTPSQGQGQWKWYKMEEINGAYKHGKCEQIWLKTLHVMFNFKLFATQDGLWAGWPAKQARLIT